MSQITASKQGTNLENTISNLLKILGIENYKENEIKKIYNDNSLNGIDHLILYPSSHNVILIQDKWKEQIDQKETSQFTQAATRLKDLIVLSDPLSVFKLLFISKTPIPSNSKKILVENNVEIIIMNGDIHIMAFSVVLHILRMINVNIPDNKLIDMYKSLPSYVPESAIIKNKQSIDWQSLLIELEKVYIELDNNFFQYIRNVLQDIDNTIFTSNDVMEYFSYTRTTKPINLTFLIKKLTKGIKNKKHKDNITKYNYKLNDYLRLVRTNENNINKYNELRKELTKCHIESIKEKLKQYPSNIDAKHVPIN